MDAAGEVKNRINIEDVLGEYVQLKRTGRNYKGLSPWTNERTPSFIVSPEKQIWHDFSSGKGGDVFSFVMEMEGLDFKGALTMLARKAGVDLEQFSDSKSGSQSRVRSHILRALDLATTFYQKQLIASPLALNYLKSRGFNKETILQWRIGYSPNARTAAVDFLGRQGFDIHEIKLTGLASDRSGKAVDMFRGRIMIPLADSRGQIIGFTARQVRDQEGSPKYINTPQTLVYDKSRHVFGLHLAKEAIRKEGFVVVVEGNADVIASHQVEVKNVVATAGTAMTEQHLKELKRFTGDIRLCYDADRAGLSATERVIPLAQKVGVSLSIVSIKDAKDPDELIQKDPKLWREVIKESKDAPDWLIERYGEQLDLESARGKKLFSDAVLAVVRRLEDPLEQEHYLKKVADATDTSLEVVKNKFAGFGAQASLPRKKIREFQPLDKTAAEYRRLQDHFLAMVFFSPKIRNMLKGLSSEFFEKGGPREVFSFLLANSDYKGGKNLPADLRTVSDYVKIISLQFEEIYQSLPAQDLSEQAAGLKQRLIDKYVKIEKSRLASLMQKTDKETELLQLMKKADQLNGLIRTTKGNSNGEEER